jgi:transcriptional regulator with XRE-family HTH domain
VISNYERGKLRPYADTVARLAEVLEVSADDLLGLPSRARNKRISTTGLSRRFVRRLQEINSLPKRDQEALIRTIDHFLGHHRLVHRAE